MSKAREGIDKLLAKYPEADVARIISQDKKIQQAMMARLSEHFYESEVLLSPGPWTIVDLYIGDKYEPFAIWNQTGNVYRVGDDGAVEDDFFISNEPGLPDRELTREELHERDITNNPRWPAG